MFVHVLDQRQELCRRQSAAVSLAGLPTDLRLVNLATENVVFRNRWVWSGIAGRRAPSAVLSCWHAIAPSSPVESDKAGARRRELSVEAGSQDNRAFSGRDPGNTP